MKYQREQWARYELTAAEVGKAVRFYISRFNSGVPDLRHKGRVEILDDGSAVVLAKFGDNETPEEHSGDG